ADAVASQVHGGGAGEIQEAALARAVADVAGLALVAGGGDDHDDAAARLALDHETRDGLGAEECAGEIHGDLALPAVERHLQHAEAAEDPGVVDEDVDATVDLADPGHHRLHLRLVGGVAGDGLGLAAAAADPLRALAGVFRLDVDARDLGALLGQAA